MELAAITMKNHLENQEISRQIRDFHKKKGQPLAIRFSEELTHIILEAPCLFIPSPSFLCTDAMITGTVRTFPNHTEIVPAKSGETINLYLNSELIAELEQIRSLVSHKTQDEVIQEMLMRGLRSYLSEREEPR
jgi:hypothetical protein